MERGRDPVSRGSRRRRQGRARRSGLPEPRGARCVGDVRRDPDRVGVRAERAGAGLRSLQVQAGLARRAQGDGRRGTEGHDRVRRHEHRPDRRGCVRPRRVSATPTSPPPSARRSPSSRRSASTTWSASAGRASACSRTGTTAPGCSTRTWECGSTWCSPAASVAGRVKAAWVDRQARKGKGPSDHAPVIVDLDEAPDGDIGPVVPPPSAPVTRRGAVKLPQS